MSFDDDVDFPRRPGLLGCLAFLGVAAVVDVVAAVVFVVVYRRMVR